MDVNARMRADHIQLWQGGIDAVNTWNSVLTASIVSDTAIQSSTAKAMAFTGAPTSTVMPGIPSVVPSQGEAKLGSPRPEDGGELSGGGSGTMPCATPAFGQACSTPVADNALSVSTFLASIAASGSPFSSAQAATAPVVIPTVPADLAAFQASSK